MYSPLLAVVPCLPNLRNQAVYEGDRNTLLNLTADPNIVRWTIIPSSDEFGSYTISDYGGYRGSSLTGLFAPNKSGLVILDAITAPNGEDPISSSGLYLAQCENNEDRTGAKLLVVREWLNSQLFFIRNWLNKYVTY